MRRLLLPTLLTLLLVPVLSSPSSAVLGADDIVAASSLIVPFFETGVDVSTHPHDTLLAVHGWIFGDFHLEVWNIDGNRVVSGQRNVFLANGETWTVAMRDLIAGLTPADRALLRQGDFYRGFVTIDGVTNSTSASPFEAGYPWLDNNRLTGSIYYTRLSEGSANGIPMIHLEHVRGSTNPLIEGFYGASTISQGHAPDDREELDNDSRHCALDASRGILCSEDADDDIDNIAGRVFHEAALGGETRLVIFAWTTGAFHSSGGPSVLCDTDPSCESTYDFEWSLADGSLQQVGKIRLDHVVNIVEISGVSGSGQWVLRNLPNVAGLTQVYAFSFNSAKPAGGAALNWDAIFPAMIDI